MVPKMRDVFNAKKTPLTKDELRQKFPQFYEDLSGRLNNFDSLNIEAFDMGDGKATMRWNHDQNDEGGGGFPNIWNGEKTIDLYDCLDSSYEPGDENMEAFSLAQEAFGDGFWTEMMDPGWGKKTKVRMDKIDAFLGSGRMQSWDDLMKVGSKDVQVPISTKKSWKN